jgi:hypothetical protein
MAKKAAFYPDVVDVIVFKIDVHFCSLIRSLKQIGVHN